MYYFAYIDANNICQSVYAMPTDLSAVAGYIAITEEEYTSQSVIGKRWNASTSSWEEVVKYYYAILDANDICIAMVNPEVEIIDGSHIAINESQYTNQTLIGWWYDREAEQWYEEAPFAAMAAHSTDEINVGTSNVCLTTKLTELETAIENAGTGSGEAGTPGTDGADGEDGGYYIPTVAADGTLSWTASKDGMPAVGSMNIKGADGQDGAPGAQGIQGIQGEPGTNGQDGAPGINGVTFTPVMTGTTLSWTNDGGLPNPASVDLKGDAGDAANVDAYTKTQVDNKLAGKADTDHTHDYAPGTHTHSTSDISGLSSLLSGKADANHTHTGYASSTHSHTGYASSSHTHSNYFPTSGGTITGETNFSGGLVRVNGVQTLYYSGSQMMISSNNVPTRICGSSISATKSITVDSDRTLKENIADVNPADCLNLIDALDVKTYNYIGDSEPCIGVIAQDIEDSPLARYLVRTTPEGKKAVKVADLVFPLIIAVQALSDHVKRLEK